MIKRAGEIGEPWGMPLATRLDRDVLPSRQIAVSCSVRNSETHLTIWTGRFFWHKMLVSLLWLTKSK
ncbi:hypothetical protein EDD17DRAFT_1490047 [Pisolithus thermaeus]|nr:hypothetical protein EDD17DRAFT_1490047 [Pisolithus thermaeus]